MATIKNLSIGIKYDNCKGCANVNCEHYGKDREFVCPGGLTCKVKQADFTTEANMFCEAVKALASNKTALNNLNCYLSRHFAAWMEKYANSPAWLAR